MSKKKEQPPPLSSVNFQSILEHIAALNQNVHASQMQLDQYYVFIKQRGINVSVLKKVAAIWDSDIRDTFGDYWIKYEEAESKIPEADVEDVELPEDDE